MKIDVKQNCRMITEIPMVSEQNRSKVITTYGNQMSDAVATI